MSQHLTVKQVLSWKPETLVAQANEWERQAAELRTRMDSQSRAVDGSRETWTGRAGDAMRDRFTQVNEKATKVRDALERGRDAAKVASLNFTTAKSLLDSAKKTAESKGLEVHDDGTCVITEKKKQYVYAAVNGDADKYTTAISALIIDCDTQTAVVKQALNNAAQIDDEAQQAINNAFADLPTAESFGNATTPKTEAKQPPKNGTPKENRQWWDSLTKQEQDAVLSTQPASVGNLDGLPADVRDQANKTVLKTEQARLDKEVTDLTNKLNGMKDATPNEFSDVASQLEDRKRRKADVDKIAEVLGKKPDHKLMVLDTMSGRQVHAAVATGDPDKADHVSVTTPGLGTNVRGSLKDMVGEADQLKAESERQLDKAGKKNETVSTIAWIGYDAPQKDADIVNVGFESRAKEAAKPLANFYEGLDVASTKNDPHITALGHSYGSLTTSLALQQKAGGVDDVVFYGSPGLGGHIPSAGTPIALLGLNDVVHSPSDLGLQDHHVYEMTEKKDPVVAFNSFGRSPHFMPWVTHLSTDPITVDDRVYTGAEGHAEYPRTDPKTNNLHRSGYNLAAVVAGLPDNAINPPGQ
ncbi:alpha/beta hydrolase [Nocardia arthritidis]|uniref:DUF1023 domain-containing protein n=1 Tax=Nocardia arthritidis TaxID=228602 RepID=A0A6G9Y6D8_9NOCA|nr:alpha/beta hydrolase [Nocardia arthritidis]QIS08808.1 hypothetical protein F5544_04470 [Nocardia arthritidis]